MLTTWDGTSVLGVLSFWIPTEGPKPNSWGKKFQAKFALQKYPSGNHQPQEGIPFSVCSDRRPLDSGTCLTQFIVQTHALYLIKKVASSHWWSQGLFIFSPLQDFSSEVLKTTSLFLKLFYQSIPLILWWLHTPQHPFLFLPYNSTSWIHLTWVFLKAQFGAHCPSGNILPTNCYWSELRVIHVYFISHKYGSITRVKKKNWFFMTNSLRSVSLDGYIPQL